MSRMRSLSFPRFSGPKKQEDTMSHPGSPYQSGSAHSRNSSGASSAGSSPIASTFSNRSHNRWPSSSSSLATSPDSPVNVTKSALHDLVEDPAEREDAFHDVTADSADEPLCICDTTFCHHRQISSASQSTVIPTSPPEWTPGDDCFSDGELPGERSSKRRKSGEYPSEGLTSRLSRRWPSISTRWKDHKPTTSVSHPTVRSAPPSRTSSMRLPSLRSSLATHLEPANCQTPPYTPADSQPEENVLSRPRALSRPSKPQEIMLPLPAEDPIDRQAFSSTPLLPPMMAKHLGQFSDKIQSPLQSPSIAEPGASASARGTPTLTPVMGSMPALPTPPLSSKPSVASFNMARSSHTLQPASEIPPMSISGEADYWAIKLGHANFHIKPEPYLPDVSNMQTCKRLLDDWESARVEYMRVTSRVSEHYGPTSQTYKLTEQKWAEIDDQWRSNLEQANAEAEANGEVTTFQTLAETQPLSKMPSLNDPQRPSKFPAVAEADIVGPMVQYAKVQRRPAKKPTLLKLFTDPSSLLGGRSAFSLRR